jgi:hypothetical protein
LLFSYTSRGLKIYSPKAEFLSAVTSMHAVYELGAREGKDFVKRWLDPKEEIQ